MFTNRLANEPSPYLQQHKHNPVDWYPWGEEAFEKARRENKPIFLSIGYSTCHWCHVMERESFEDNETAEILNQDFVSIKVDREERPDVDRIYMLFVQATTGGGGWPMSVWLTPERKPFYGGTYFPPDNRYGRPSFRRVLTHLAEAWKSDRTKIDESVADIMGQLEVHAALKANAGGRLGDEAADRLYNYMRRTFDTKYGGFGTAPKFPRPVQLCFLLRYWAATRTEEALDMTVATLWAMARGGMNDQLGGGFHRYSVDARWFVPHFEKMLYDQGQLAVNYLETYQITGEPAFAGEARRILDYVLRDMTDAKGGFYSAEDADSVIDSANPKEKGEGAFYVFEWRELEAVLGELGAQEAAAAYGLVPEGNVSPHEDPHEEFTRKNILYRAGERTAGLDGIDSKLLSYRNLRTRPHLDDKVLTSWNGLMISAFAKGAQVLEDARYLEAARRSALFLLSAMWNAETGVLLRRWRSGNAAIHGFLDDYAFFANALVDLYETAFEAEYLAAAQAIADSMLGRFEDSEAGAFYSTAAGDAELVMRLKEDYDGAEPSGNAMAVIVLQRLAAITGDARYEAAATRTLSAFQERLENQPAAAPLMMASHLFSLRKPRQIQFTGAEPDAFIRIAHRHFAPFQVMIRDQQTGGAPQARVCENFVCHTPLEDPRELEAMLTRG